MATVRRFFVLGAVLAVVLLLGGRSVEHFPTVPGARAAGPESFTQAFPSTVYAGDPSHIGTAPAAFPRPPA